MIENQKNTSENIKQQLSIEKVCEEYNNSVKFTLDLINHHLDRNLNKSYHELDDLSTKIATRTNFLENNPTFLSCLSYFKENVKTEALREFDEIKITLKENAKRITEKIDEVENYHKKLFELVEKSSRNSDVLECIDEMLEIVKKEATPETKESFDKVIIQKNAYSDNTQDDLIITNGQPIKFQVFPDLPADVERRKPIEDIHQRLINQLEATDSFEGFLKLMERKPSTKKKIKPKTAGGNLQDKYTGSLWFFPQNKNIKKKTSNKNILTPKISTTQKNHKTPKLFKNSTLTCSCNLLVTSSQTPMTNQDKTRKAKDGMRTKLKCYDLLDDIEGKDLKPIKSEYPRRDNLYYEKNRKNSKTYLHRMMEENDKVWEKLLQAIPLKQEIKKLKDKRITNLMNYLTAPDQQILCHQPQSLIVMPVKVYYDNFPTKETTSPISPEDYPTPRISNLMCELTKSIQESPSPKKQNVLLSKLPPEKKTVKKPEPKPISTIFGGKKPETQEEASSKKPKPINTIFSEKKPETQEEASPKKPKPINTIFSEKKPETQEEASSKKPKFPLQKKQEMLEHLRGLKLKNDSIQRNIQKAIDVIESKMIDLLSSPADSNSNEAFTAMEMEITNVLKMMNDNQKKGEKVEAEKDENQKMKISSPKVKKVTPHKPIGVSDFVPGVDLPNDKPKKTNEEVTTKKEEHEPPNDKPKRPNEEITTKKEETKPPNDKPKKPNEETKQPPNDKPKKPNEEIKMKKEETKQVKRPNEEVQMEKEETKQVTIDENKKMADIEEGERLLNQVDNVIKKIDNIYTKFYDGGKPKMTVKNEATFNNVIDFFDGLKTIIQLPPIEISYKKMESTPGFQQAKIYHQTMTYHDVSFIPKQPTESGDCKFDLIASEHNWQTVTETDWDDLNRRHEATLKTFYTLFFSGIFIALNYNYVA